LLKPPNRCSAAGIFPPEDLRQQRQCLPRSPKACRPTRTTKTGRGEKAGFRRFEGFEEQRDGDGEGDDSSEGGVARFKAQKRSLEEGR